MAICSSQTGFGNGLGTCASALDCPNAKPAMFPTTGFVEMGQNFRIDSSAFTANSIPVFDTLLLGENSSGVKLTADSSLVGITCKKCLCDDQDPAAACLTGAPSAPSGCVGGYAVPYLPSGTICIKFGGDPLLAGKTSGTAVLQGSQLIVTLSDSENSLALASPVTFDTGVYATDAGGNLIGLALRQADITAVAYFGCGPFVVLTTSSDSVRKRQVTSFSPTTSGPGVFTASASGDPHLSGANGVKYDLKGVAGGVYSLFISPVFQINMQLAEIGPEIRFMTKMGILYRGIEVIVNPWSVKTNAYRIAEQFNKLNATVKVDRWQMIITFCNNHVVTITSMHTVDGALNFLDFTVSVPGCHDSYGGALGHTYECAYALGKKKFEWSMEREESFQIKTLVTPSGTYSKDAECAHEDEFGSKELLGGRSL